MYVYTTAITQIKLTFNTLAADLKAIITADFKQKAFFGLVV